MSFFLLYFIKVLLLPSNGHWMNLPLPSASDPTGDTKNIQRLETKDTFIDLFKKKNLSIASWNS